MPEFHQDYTPRFFFKNAMFNTTFASKYRKVSNVAYQRRRVELQDGDFIDVDIASIGSKNTALIVHGLGGHSGRSYVRGMVRLFHKHNWDAVAFNMRGCSGETNRLLETYHSGRTEDLRELSTKLFSSLNYDKKVLVGFSLGGNQILKYLGEEGSSSLYSAGIAISAPVDLTAASKKMENDPLLMQYFFKKLKKYLLEKQELFPNEISLEGFEQLNTFKDYDDRYTAPMNGFKNAEEYWQKSSALQFLPDIRVPTLLVNAKDDPVLSAECFPSPAMNNELSVSYPQYGGHVGFCQFGRRGLFWHEELTAAFLKVQRICSPDHH